MVEWFCHYSIARTQKHPARCRDLGHISCTNWVMVYIVSNFVAMAWQRGLVVLEIIWHHLIVRPRKPPDRCKNLGDISYRSWVIVDFVSNSVAIATGVGRGGICLTSFNSPTPKTPCYVLESRIYLPQKPSYCLFCHKFRCHGNRGQSWIKLPDITQ